ncbi:MAG TPA: hypothetical protein PLE30_10160 [Candidatus Kapabacteria bacterium]|nr:hypothetical protein [Candidatus Kapabacteria bacterium]
MSIAKSAIFYDMYNLNTVSGHLVQRADINTNELSRSIYHYFQLTSYTSISYCVYLVSLIIILLLNKGKIKENGWLFMIAVLSLIFSPFELYIVYKDVDISSMIFWGKSLDINSSKILDYMSFRSNSEYSLISSLSFLSQITIFIFAVFKPLNQNINK